MEDANELNLIFDNIEHEYIIARWCYGLGISIISDEQYSLLHKAIIEKGVLKEYADRSWSSDPCPVDLLEKYNLNKFFKDIVLSDKTESITSLGSYVEIERDLKHINYPVKLSFKHDGWNIRLSYMNGKLVLILTRGRSSDSIDVSVIRQNVAQTLKEPIDATIICELTLSKEKFRKLKADYPSKNLKSIRNAVSTAVSLENGYEYLSVTGLDILEKNNIDDIESTLIENGFNTPMFITVNSYEELLEMIEVYSNAKESYPYPTDGLVIRSMDGTFKRAIRVGAWEEKINMSYVTGYIEEGSRHNFNFRASIYPIKLENSTHKIVNITNLNRAIENNITVGSPIAFKMTSQSYPDIDLTATRILQYKYKDDYERFRQEIEDAEANKITDEYMDDVYDSLKI